jgi:peptide/nickel transport system substrate-binding protein
MLMRAKRTSFAGCALVWATALSCAAPPAAPDGTRGSDATTAGTLAGPKRNRAAFLSNPPTLNNSINQTVAGGRTYAGVVALENLLNMGLTIHDDRGILTARLVEQVPSVENGLWRIAPDGQTETTWRLKQGLQWHDGAPFSAEDLLFSVRIAHDRELPLTPRVGYELVEAIFAPEPYTVTVRWRRPLIEADALFGARDLLPRHLLERTHTEDKASFAHHPFWSTEYIGLGPFQLRESVRDSHLIMDANARYVLGRPKLDELEVRFLPDPNVLAANILAGVVEMTLGRSLALETAVQLGEQWREGKVEIFPASGTPLHLYPQFINPQPPVIAEVPFRRALLHALDREELVDTILRGKGAVAHGLFWDPSEPEYREIERRIVRYDHDPRKAAQLIQGLGYVRASDGFYRDSRDATAQRLGVELRTLASFDTSVKAIYPIADYWRRAGVEVEAFVVPEQRVADREYRATRPGFDLPSVPREVSRLHSREIALPENSFRGANRARYGNAEFDHLIDRYHVTIPWAERMAVLGDIVQHLSDRVIAMGLFFNVTPTLVSNRLVNVKAASGAVASADGVQIWNAHEWDVILATTPS